MEIDAKAIIEKNLRQCYDIHGVEIPDKYLPYINRSVAEIIVAVLKEAANSAVTTDRCEGDSSFGYCRNEVKRESIISVMSKVHL